MVTYAQQTDKEKARISSIDTTKVIDAPEKVSTDKANFLNENIGQSMSVKDKDGKDYVLGKDQWGNTTRTLVNDYNKKLQGARENVASVMFDANGNKIENRVDKRNGDQPTGTSEKTSNEKRLAKLRPNGEPTDNTVPDWIGQPFANNAKIVEQKAKATAVETSKRLATTQASVIATDYQNGGVSAMELQALKESDPLKFQEVSLALEKQNTLDAINMNQEQFLTNYQKLTDTYMKARESMLNDTTGQELRQQIFEQYGLNKSNEMIKNYTTQIDKLDDEFRNLEDWTGTGDALMDRGELVRKGRDLSRQRMDTVRARQAEVDYYRLGLEQADAVVKDYKEAQGQRMDMMGKQFEMATGMSTLEFDMQQSQLTRELADINSYISSIATSKAEELKYTRELEKEGREFERDVFMEDLKRERDINKAMTMAELNFGYDVQLNKMSYANQVQLHNMDASTKMQMLRASKELDMMFPEYQFKEIEIDGVKTQVAVNPYDPTDYKSIDPNISKDYLTGIGSGVITSRGGKHDNYQGVDIDGKIGDPVPSLGGTVVKVVSGQGKSDKPSYGNYVDVKDENGYIHRYAHLNSVNVKEGDAIAKGGMLGTIGNSGYTIATGGGDGSHLDYSVKRADGNFMSSSEIPGYLSTLKKEEALPQPITELFGILQSIKDGNSGFHGAVGFKGFINKGIGLITGKTDEGLPIGTEAGSFAKRVEQVKNILAFDNLDKLKGAMSDNDLKFLKSINTSISIDMTETEFVKELERVENSLLTKYGTTLPKVLKLPDFDNEENISASSYLSQPK